MLASAETLKRIIGIRMKKVRSRLVISIGVSS